MGALIALLVIAGVSLVVVKLGAAALTMTGMSAHAASFQSYSAFFGVGFTTKEAEMVMSHRVRRRIIRDLILAGNIGLTSALATLVVTFVQSGGEEGNTMKLLGMLILGAFGFWLLTRSKLLNRALEWSIEQSLEKLSSVRSMDYEPLLHVEAGFCISEFEVFENNTLAGRTIAESHPTDIGIVILGISKKDGKFIGAPGPQDSIELGDAVTVYGHEEAIFEIRGLKDLLHDQEKDDVSAGDGDKPGHTSDEKFSDV